MKRKITAISMVDSFTGENKYEVGEQTNNGLEVTHIVYRRDGLQDINHRSNSESGYLVRLINELDKETPIFKFIPLTMVEEMTFIEEEEKEEEVKVQRIS